MIRLSVLLLGAWLACFGLVRAVELPPLSGNVPLGSGLRAEYYNGIHFDQKVLSRIEKQVNYTWSNQRWIPGLNELYFSARWTGKLYAPVNGSYLLVTRVDDGIRLWLNGKLLLDEWHGQSVTTYKREVNLVGGRYYDLKIEYFNFYGPGVMQLSWESPEEETTAFFNLLTHRPLTLIPGKYLFSPAVTPTKPAIARHEPEPAPEVRKVVSLPNKPTAKLRSNAPKIEATHPRQPLPPLASEMEKKPPREDIFENLESGKAVVLQHVLFEQSTYVLLKESYGELDKLVKTLRAYPHWRIEIAGHTDSMGDARPNQALSENRATVVANYLIRNGIAENRLEVKGYGSTQPIADNSVETERAKNRRVAFKVKE